LRLKSQSSRVLEPKLFFGPVPIYVGNAYSASVALLDSCHWKRRSVGVKALMAGCTPCLDGESNIGRGLDGDAILPTRKDE
jgi:hypothetical protein